MRDRGIDVERLAGLLDLLVVHLDIFVVLVDRRVVGLEVGLDQRLLLGDELLHAILVSGVLLLPRASLRITGEIAGVIAGFRAAWLGHRSVVCRGCGLAESGNGENAGEKKTRQAQ